MGLFDKVIKTTQSVGTSIGNSAVKAGSSVGTSAKDQAEISSIKMEINVIDQELNASYQQIGRKYVDFVLKTGEMPGVDVSDTLKLLDPKITRKNELEAKLVEVEKRVKQQNVLREKSKAEEEFNMEKTKLERAVAMGVLDQSECDAKLLVLQKKLDNFEAIRKIEQQCEMGIITNEEKETKIKQLTE